MQLQNLFILKENIIVLNYVWHLKMKFKSKDTIKRHLNFHMIIRPPYSRTCSESNKGEYYFSLAVKLSTGRELFKAIKCALGAHKIKRNKWHQLYM